MKKILIFFAMSFSLFLAQNSCTAQEEVNKSDEVSELFQQTLEYLDKNPQIVDDMIKEIQSSEELVNLFKMLDEEQKEINADVTTEDVKKFLEEKISSSNNFAEKIIIDFGGTDFAKTLAQDEDIKLYLINKMKNDEEFAKRVFSLLPKKEQAKFQAEYSVGQENVDSQK